MKSKQKKEMKKERKHVQDATKMTAKGANTQRNSPPNVGPKLTDGKGNG